MDDKDYVRNHLVMSLKKAERNLCQVQKNFAGDQFLLSIYEPSAKRAVRFWRKWLEEINREEWKMDKNARVQSVKAHFRAVNNHLLKLREIAEAVDRERPGSVAGERLESLRTEAVRLCRLLQAED